jgi:heme A synthase
LTPGTVLATLPVTVSAVATVTAVAAVPVIAMAAHPITVLFVLLTAVAMPLAAANSGDRAKERDKR